MTPYEAVLPYEYATIRVVPRVDRGEFVNVGVIVYCRERDFLRTAVHLDDALLLALDPGTAVDDVRAALDRLVHTCAGAGPAADEQLGRRFRWLTAPRSTIVQPGPVHTGMTADPAAETDHLLQRLVLR